MGDFGFKYSNSRTTNNRGHDTTTRKKFNIHQNKNSIVKHTVDEILLNKNNKVSAEDKAHDNIEYNLDENDLYQIYSMSLNEKKENTK